MRVLVVDDDIMALEMLKFSLERAGHHVSIATNGREALEVLRRDACRVVISDWEMPEIDGLEFCRLLRRDHQDSYVYVILLTGRKGTQSIVAGLTAGADDFLTKPFDPEEILVRLHTAERILSLETRDLTIFALAKLAESRDPDTGRHLERVRNYSRLLAAQLATYPEFSATINGSFIALIYQTSPLHDIGKIAIPDSVLLKAGSLNDAEYAIMKTHATHGAETLGAALRQYPEAIFLQMARDIAATHHERWDGSGYPAGLRGNAIPLCGRIVALADVYDALTSKRVYKSAMNHATARSIILEGSGKHFDPAIVQAFLAREADFIAISHHHAEPTQPAASPAAA